MTDTRDFFRAKLSDTCVSCGEPNAHYIGDGCREGLEHVIIADGPPICRVCIWAAVGEAHHQALDEAIRRTTQLPPPAS